MSFEAGRKRKENRENEKEGGKTEEKKGPAGTEDGKCGRTDPSDQVRGLGGVACLASGLMLGESSNGVDVNDGQWLGWGAFDELSFGRSVGSLSCPGSECYSVYIASWNDGYAGGGVGWGI